MRNWARTFGWVTIAICRILLYKFLFTKLTSLMTRWCTYLFNPYFLWYCLTYGESESEVAQSCLTLCDPVDCSLPGFSVHGILQARVLEWVAISFSRGSSQHRDWTQVSRIAGRRFNLWATSLGRHITLTHVKFLTTKPPVMSQDFLNPDAFFRHYNVKEISK